MASNDWNWLACVDGGGLRLRSSRRLTSLNAFYGKENRPPSFPFRCCCRNKSRPAQSVRPSLPMIYKEHLALGAFAAAAYLVIEYTKRREHRKTTWTASNDWEVKRAKVLSSVRKRPDRDHRL